MQTQTDLSVPFAPRLSVFSAPRSYERPGKPTAAEPVKAPCETSLKLMTLLEEITGWKSEFFETPSSYRNRSQEGMAQQPAQGTFSIVDMSADWPANQFTAHRGKCDRLVGLIGDLVGELQSAKFELSRLRSVTAALPGEISDEQDDEILVDSFVPKFGRVEIGNVESRPPNVDPPKSISRAASKWDDKEFEVLQELGEELVPPPFAGWSLGGTTGIVEDTYLDWLVDAQERISISVGKIESRLGEQDRQAVLTVEPLTSEFRVASQGEIKAFYHWDAAAKRIRLTKPSVNWVRLGMGDAIIASTNENLDPDTMMAELESLSAAHPTAESIAQVINNLAGDAKRTLVLKRQPPAQAD